MRKPEVWKICSCSIIWISIVNPLPALGMADGTPLIRKLEGLTLQSAAHDGSFAFGPVRISRFRKLPAYQFIARQASMIQYANLATLKVFSCKVCVDVLHRLTIMWSEMYIIFCTKAQESVYTVSWV